MNQPEFILEDSGKIALTANQLANLLQRLVSVEVDLVVLSKELIRLGSFSKNITRELRELVLCSQEQELQE